jgi:hypothetical protein
MLPLIINESPLVRRAQSLYSTHKYIIILSQWRGRDIVKACKFHWECTNTNLAYSIYIKISDIDTQRLKKRSNLKQSYIDQYV